MGKVDWFAIALVVFGMLPVVMGAAVLFLARLKAPQRITQGRQRQHLRGSAMPYDPE
jgi:hypothetical protein